MVNVTKSTLRLGKQNLGVRVCERDKEGFKVTKKKKHICSSIWYGFSHLVAVVHGGDYLSEEVSRLPLAQAAALADVVIQLALAGILHHNHDLVLVLKH